MEYLKQNKKTILKRQVLPLAAGKGRWKGKIGGGKRREGKDRRIEEGGMYLMQQ